jgi:hypothetical protein
MKHVELICELMLSLVQGDVLNKKTALDRVMATSSFDGRQLGKALRMVTITLNRIRRMFPQIKTTRLRQVTDFYTLAFVIGRFEQEGLILTDRRRNALLGIFCKPSPPRWTKYVNYNARPRARDRTRNCTGII